MRTEEKTIVVEYDLRPVRNCQYKFMVSTGISAEDFDSNKEDTEALYGLLAERFQKEMKKLTLADLEVKG